MKIKIFCRCSLFPSWSGYRRISNPVLYSDTINNNIVLGVFKFLLLKNKFSDYENNTWLRFQYELMSRDVCVSPQFWWGLFTGHVTKLVRILICHSLISLTNDILALVTKFWKIKIPSVSKSEIKILSISV